MQAVSRWLEKNPGSHSFNRIEEHVKGKGQYKRDAIEALVAQGSPSKRKGLTGRV